MFFYGVIIACYASTRQAKKGTGQKGDYSSWWNKGGHPIQICADYDRNRCDQCYRRGRWESESYCKGYWHKKGWFWHDKADFFWFVGGGGYKYNNFTYSDLMTTKLSKVKRHFYTYHAQSMHYRCNGPIQFGCKNSSNYFQGLLKDVYIDKDGSRLGIWRFNDGDNSSIASDTSGEDRNAKLHNFDTNHCWRIDPILKKYYENSIIQERQSVPKFKMIQHDIKISSSITNLIQSSLAITQMKSMPWLPAPIGIHPQHHGLMQLLH